MLTRHRWAPFVATAGGFGLAVGFAAAHWLPTWGELSDSFVDRPTAAFSYLASSLEILGAVAVGACGLAVWLADARRSSSPAARPTAGRP